MVLIVVTLVAAFAVVVSFWVILAALAVHAVTDHLPGRHSRRRAPAGTDAFRGAGAFRFVGPRRSSTGRA